MQVYSYTNTECIMNSSRRNTYKFWQMAVENKH